MLYDTHRTGLEVWDLNLLNSPGAVHSEPCYMTTDNRDSNSFLAQMHRTQYPGLYYSELN